MNGRRWPRLQEGDSKDRHAEECYQDAFCSCIMFFILKILTWAWPRFLTVPGQPASCPTKAPALHSVPCHVHQLRILILLQRNSLTDLENWSWPWWTLKQKMQSNPSLLIGFLMADVCATTQTQMQAWVVTFLSDIHTRSLTNLIEVEAILAQENHYTYFFPRVFLLQWQYYFVPYTARSVFAFEFLYQSSFIIMNR